MSIKIMLPSLPVGEKHEIVEALTEALSLLEIAGETIELEPEQIVIRIDGRQARQTKGEHIWRLIQEVVETGEFMDRNQIAEAVGCTVSRIAEVLKANAGAAATIQYRRMAEEARLRKILAADIAVLGVSSDLAVVTAEEMDPDDVEPEEDETDVEDDLGDVEDDLGDVEDDLGDVDE